MFSFVHVMSSLKLSLMFEVWREKEYSTGYSRPVMQRLELVF